MDSARSLKLNTGALMPTVGLGTWLSKRGEVGAAVRRAILECGYHHIDGAWIYQNEKEIGEAYGVIFTEGSAKREEIFITSKLWNSFHAREHVASACKQTLRDLKLDYLDLYLMHWGMATPEGDTEDENGFAIFEKIPLRETWEAMQGLVKEGLVKAIGVSNFTVPMLIDLLSYAEISPAVNQIELHPYLQQTRLVEFCHYRGIAVTAYSPLGRPGYPDMSERVLEDPVILKIARAYGKTPAQVALRWGVQRRTIVIPKSTHPKRIKENIDVFDFELSENEMRTVAGLERGLRLVDPYKWGKVPYFD
jgi:diketogulonate reductase-like aldo/keto reductase